MGERREGNNKGNKGRKEGERKRQQSGRAHLSHQTTIVMERDISSTSSIPRAKETSANAKHDSSTNGVRGVLRAALIPRAANNRSIIVAVIYLCYVNFSFSLDLFIFLTVLQLSNHYDMITSARGTRHEAHIFSLAHIYQND